MTPKQALKVALKVADPKFMEYHNLLQKLASNPGSGSSAVCQRFVVNGENFHYGFDAVNVKVGKYTKKLPKKLLPFYIINV